MSDSHETMDPYIEQPDRKEAFRLLFFSLLAIGAGNTMLISAVLPPLIRELEMPDWTAGAIFSFSALCWSMSSPVWGRLSNRWGRRRVAGMGLGGYSLSMGLFGITAILALANILQGIIFIFICLALSRAFFGVVGSASYPAAQAYVADRTHPEERTTEISSLTAGFTVGTIVGPLFAAALVGAFTYLFPRFGIVSPVMIAMLLAGLMSYLLFTQLPERRKPKADATNFGLTERDEAKGLWRSWKVAPYLIYAVVLSVATGVIIQTFSFAVMDKMGVTGPEAVQFTGPAFTFGAMGTLLSQLILIPKLHASARTLMIYGPIPMAIGALMIIPAGEGSYAILLVSYFLIGLGQGLVRPGFSSGASLAVTPRLQGNVAGLIVSANGLGFVVTPIFGLAVYQYVNVWIPFALVAGLLVFMSIFAALVLKSDNPHH